jgi:hypothetical protein
MRKCGIILIITALLALNCAGQTSSSKNAVDPLKAATKPLTSKAPITTGKSWVTPPPTADTRRTNEELTRLERQTVATSNSAPVPSKKNKPGNIRNGPIKTSTTSSSGSGINATYQKPHIPPK